MRFMNTLQDPGEKPSTYLHRLQVVLNLTVRRGGMSPQEVDKHLLKQFCTGCWDNALLADLQLELKKQTPPSFANLLLLLRAAEDRQEAKNTRMEWHLSVTRQKAVSHVHGDCETDETKVESDASGINELKKKVADLKSQLTALMKLRKDTAPRKEQTKKSETKKPDQYLNRPLPLPELSLPSQSRGTVFVVGRTVTLLPPVNLIQNLP